MDMINKDILRPIGTIIICIIGLLFVALDLNKIFIASVFGILIFDSISAMKNRKVLKK